jgi:hypothetical protein
MVKVGLKFIMMVNGEQFVIKLLEMLRLMLPVDKWIMMEDHQLEVKERVELVIMLMERISVLIKELKFKLHPLFAKELKKIYNLANFLEMLQDANMS